MPTKIMLQNRKTGDELAVSTHEFARIRGELEKPGAYEDYFIDPDPHTGTMRHFRDDKTGKRNFFLEDVMRGLYTTTFKSQSFPAFQTALSNAETARNTFIITARGHSREHFKMGLRALKKVGLIKFLIPLENIWGVSSPDFAEHFKSKFKEDAPEASVGNPSHAKAEVMIRLHDLIDKRPIPKTKIPVISPDGDGAGFFHLTGFSDDDLGNYEAGRNAFLHHLKEGRWPNTKFTLFFTSHHHTTEPKTEVLTSQGVARPLLKSEHTEWVRIFEAKYGRSPDLARKEQAGAINDLFSVMKNTRTTSQEPRSARLVFGVSDSKRRT